MGIKTSNQEATGLLSNTMWLIELQVKKQTVALFEISAPTLEEAQQQAESFMKLKITPRRNVKETAYGLSRTNEALRVSENRGRQD